MANTGGARKLGGLANKNQASIFFFFFNDEKRVFRSKLAWLQHNKGRHLKDI